MGVDGSGREGGDRARERKARPAPAEMATTGSGAASELGGDVSTGRPVKSRGVRTRGLRCASNRLGNILVLKPHDSSKT